MLTYKDDYLMHYGIKGQKKGRRRFQNPDGSLTAAGRLRYLDPSLGRSSGSFIKVQEGSNRPKDIIGSTGGVKKGGSVVGASKSVKNASMAAVNTAVTSHLGNRYRTADYDEINDKANKEFRDMGEYREYNKTGEAPRSVKRAVEKVLEPNKKTGYSVPAITEVAIAQRAYGIADPTKLAEAIEDDPNLRNARSDKEITEYLGAKAAQSSKKSSPNFTNTGAAANKKKVSEVVTKQRIDKAARAVQNVMSKAVGPFLSKKKKTGGGRKDEIK